MSAIIEVKDLLVRFGERTVLDHLNFEVREGEIFVILGGSGCGKSTLLRHMIGLRKPEAGTILIDGQCLDAEDPASRTLALREVGVAFQSGALFGSMTLLENVCLPLQEKTSLPAAIIIQTAKYKLRLVGLGAFANYLPAELSGGMQKRAAIARALALDPRILFLDEPSAGLDPITSANLDALIKRLAVELGVTFVVVTHELPSIFAIADRVIMLQDGKIVAQGRPQDLAAHSEVPYVRQFFNRESETVGEL